MESKDTESKIIKAAEHEFLTKGFAGARTTSIAREAGVTHAMLHYYFRTKENLFERIATEKFGLLKQLFLVPLEDYTLPLNEVIRHIINHHIDLLLENPGLPQFILTEIYANQDRTQIISSQIKENVSEVFDRLQQKIDMAAEKGLCRKTDARMLMIDIVSLNIFSFMAAPLLTTIIGIPQNHIAAFMEKRKNDNYNTIMKILNP